MKHPLRTQLTYVADLDLREAAVTASGKVAIVGKPVGSDWS